MSNLSALPAGYRPRPYGGACDHQAMADVLSRFEMAHGGEMSTAEQIGLNYSLLSDDDLGDNVVLLEHDADGVIGYARVGIETLPDGIGYYVVAPLLPEHDRRDVFVPLLSWFESRATARATQRVATARDGPVDTTQFMRLEAPHPGPDAAIDGCRAAWVLQCGFTVSRYFASMVRPHLDDIPQLAIPDDAEIRPVAVDQIRTVWEAHEAAFAGSFGHKEPTEADWLGFLGDPTVDISLWKVAWAGERIVGQVLSYINPEENAAANRLRGYTEMISTAPDWRGRGLASALLAASLHELRRRGYSEAALGVDTANPANALGIYERLGFVVDGFVAAFDKPLDSSGAAVDAH